MRTHAFPTARETISLRSVVDSLDARTRKEGLHVLQGWDFVAHRFPDDIAPVLLLDFCERNGALERFTRESLAILLDQYFLAVLQLFAVRVWDEGDANVNLDRISAMLADLQGENGCGHRFIDDAESLLMLAVSYYHPEEPAYDRVLAKVRTLDESHRLRFALPCASIMASHLRWGLRFMYRRDVGVMRNDNVVDYPWLQFALLTLMRAYVAGPAGEAPAAAARARIVEALMDGLSADPWAFAGQAPAFLAPVQTEHDELRSLLSGHRNALLEEFERQRPTAKNYSPLAFSCNFLSNASVAMLVLAVGGAKHPSMNALLSRAGGDAANNFARALMEYSATPERLGHGGAPLIVLDPYEGISCFNTLVRTLKT